MSREGYFFKFLLLNKNFLQNFLGMHYKINAWSIKNFVILFTTVSLEPGKVIAQNRFLINICGLQISIIFIFIK